MLGSQHTYRLISASAGIAALLVATACTPGVDDEDIGTAGTGQCSSIRVAEIIVTQFPQEQREWQQEAAATFEEETGVAIQFETMGSAADQQTLMQTSAISGTGPDIFVSGTTFVPVASATGAFHELSDDDWDAIGGRDRFYQEPLGISGQDADSQIAVPYVQRPFGMVYNTEMFEEAGFAGPPQTWDEYIEMSEYFTNTDITDYGSAIAYSSDFDPWKYIWMYTKQYGGELVSDDNTTALLDSDEVVDATTAYFDLVTETQGFDPRSVSWDSPQVQAAFAQGDIAMAPMATPTWEPDLSQSEIAGQYAYAPHPLVPPGHDALPSGGVEAGTIVSGDMLMLADYSECKAAALDYIEWVTSVDKQTEYYDIFGSIPANQEAGTRLAEEDELVAAFLESIDASVPTSFVGAWSNVQLGLGNTVEQSLPALADRTYEENEIRELLTVANNRVQGDLDQQQAYAE